jgi:ATP sulfurylase
MELEKYNVKQTKISGTKIRGLLMQINKLTKEARKEILEAQKAVPKKPRAKKETVAKEDDELVEKVVAPTPPVKAVKSTKSKKKI